MTNPVTPSVQCSRLNVGIMLFMSAFTVYILRVNMSINILGMVHPILLENDTTDIDPPDYGPRYNWSPEQQSLLLGSYFWGYMLTQLPGGILSEFFGARLVIGCALGLSGCCTACIPLAAKFSFWVVFSVRVLTGIVAGFIYPAMHGIISKWSPKSEKGKFMFTVLGGSLGTVITWPLAGWLMEKYGWVYAFYAPATFTLFVTFVWFVSVYNSPAEHPRISDAEQQYIERSLGNTVSRTRRGFPPISRILTSIPCWALLILHYGNTWAFYFLITGAPKYMNEILKFNLTQSGILASAPYLSRFVCGFIFGAINDLLVRHNTFQVTTIRKFFCIFSHIIPGALLYSLSFVGYNPIYCVIIITAALGFNGASTVTNLSNAQDLAPNYAAIIFGIINFFGTTAGIISPLVVTYFTREQNTIEEWNKIFSISAILYVIPAIVFILLGSGKVQEWNDDSYKMRKSVVSQQRRFTGESRF